MDAADHYRRAEELAAKASEYLGQGDGQDSALAWAAVAQVHATLALSAVTGTNPPGPTVGRPPKTSTAGGPADSPWAPRPGPWMEGSVPPLPDVEPDDPDDET